ncbi:MAG: 50S ribosomal protein L22 [Dehalococcoidia bacterium]
MAVKATAKRIAISPQKLQPIMRLIRGKGVQQALEQLQFLPSPAAREVSKVVKSAAASAENNLLLNPQSLRIVQATADKGPVLRRFEPRARGRVYMVRKRYSQITVMVDEEG